MLIIIAIGTIFLQNKADNSHSDAKDRCVLGLCIQMLCELRIKENLMLLRFFQSRHVEILEVSILEKVQQIGGMKNRPTSCVLMMFFCSLYQKFDEVEDIKCTSKQKLVLVQMRFFKRISAWGIFENTCEITTRVLQNSFEVDMRTTEKRLILQHMLQHVATIFTNAINPLRNPLLLTAVNDLRNPHTDEKPFSHLFLSDNQVSVLSNFHGLIIAQGDWRLAGGVGVWMALGLRWGMDDAAHLNSYYINVIIQHHARLCFTKIFLIYSNTWSGSTSEFTLQFLFSSEQYFMISLVSFSQVRNRFLMLFMLSSERPLVSPRFSSRANITSSPHYRCKMKGSSILLFMILSQVDKFSMFLGNPSMRKRPPQKPAFFMAFSSSITVISLGTILPSTMCFSMIYPYCEPAVFLSSLSRSPAERWVNLKCLVILSLWVPLPEPGPPKMMTTIVFFFPYINKSQTTKNYYNSIKQSFTLIQCLRLSELANLQSQNQLLSGRHFLLVRLELLRAVNQQLSFMVDSRNSELLQFGCKLRLGH